jgi:hypothetical protein
MGGGRHAPDIAPQVEPGPLLVIPESLTNLDEEPRIFSQAGDIHGTAAERPRRAGVAV